MLSVMIRALQASENASTACQTPAVTARQSRALGWSPIWKKCALVWHPDIKQTNCLTIPQRTRIPKYPHLSIILRPQETFILQQLQSAPSEPNSCHEACLAWKRYYWLYLFVWFHMLPRYQSQIFLISVSCIPKANLSRPYLIISSIFLC